MIKKSIKLIEKQIGKLQEEDFDLEAWKASSCALLDRIFGTGNPKTDQIKSIRMDFGSWSLRDTGASRDPLRSCKKQGEELLLVAIDELNTFGISRLDENLQLTRALKEIITVNQYDKIERILNEALDRTEKEKKLLKALGSIDKQKIQKIITELLMVQN